MDQLIELPHCNRSENGSLTPYKKDVILIVYASTGLVSIIVSLTAVLLVLCLRLYPRFVYRLVLYQELSSILLSLTQCIGLLQLSAADKAGYDRDAVCSANGFLLQYALWAKLMFTLWLVFHLFYLGVFLKNCQRLELLYIFSSIIFPLIPAVIPLATKSYGIDGARCWIDDRDSDCHVFVKELAEIYTLWYGPAIISLLLANSAIVLLLLIMRHRAYNEVDPELTPLVRKNKQALRQMLPLVFYPLLFLVLMVIPVVTRLISDALGDRNNFVLILLHGIAYPPGGCFSGLAVIIHVCIMHGQRKRKANEPLKKGHIMYDKCTPFHEHSTFSILV